MRMFLAAIALICIVSVARPDAKRLLKITEESVTASEKLVDVLKGVKDKASANSALPKVTELGSLLRQCQQASIIARGEVTKEDLKTVTDRFAERQKRAERQLQAECKRIEAIPEAFAVVRDTIYFKLIEDGRREERAKLQLKVLTTATAAYKLKYGDFPDKLQLLVQPPDGAPYLNGKEELIDPWGRPYEYDAKGPKHKGLLPDIWSLGSRPKEGTIIGNWSE